MLGLKESQEDFEDKVNRKERKIVDGLTCFFTILYGIKSITTNQIEKESLKETKSD